MKGANKMMDRDSWNKLTYEQKVFNLYYWVMQDVRSGKYSAVEGVRLVRNLNDMLTYTCSSAALWNWMQQNI